ncbi:MAG: hypothetical protein B6U89_07255 [Desulfurococcales archaeon ex4484_58]|nr:MAG: hypothetical protein B6U89_07255 [Desulfurococcales archaeon ex4484_58]
MLEITSRNKKILIIFLILSSIILIFYSYIFILQSRETIVEDTTGLRIIYVSKDDINKTIEKTFSLLSRFKNVWDFNSKERIIIRCVYGGYKEIVKDPVKLIYYCKWINLTIYPKYMYVNGELRTITFNKSINYYEEELVYLGTYSLSIEIEMPENTLYIFLYDGENYHPSIIPFVYIIADSYYSSQNVSSGVLDKYFNGRYIIPIYVYVNGRLIEKTPQPTWIIPEEYRNTSLTDIEIQRIGTQGVCWTPYNLASYTEKKLEWIEKNDPKWFESMKYLSGISSKRLNVTFKFKVYLSKELFELELD